MVNSSIGLGGVPRVMSLWSKLFIEKGYKVEVVANIKSQIFYDFNKEVEKTFLDIDQFGNVGKLKIFFRLKKFFTNRENQIIFFNKAHYINYIFILKFLGYVGKENKLVYYVHGGSSDFKIFYSNFKKYLIYKTFSRVIALHDDYYTFIYMKNKKLKRLIIDCFFPDSWMKIKKKIVYIPNPVSFRTDKKANLNSKTFIAAGRLDYIKGFDLLIKSWVDVEKSNLTLKLKIFGDGPEKESLERLIKKLKLKNITLSPATKNIKDELLNSCGYIMSSREEGMPMILLEAMECGLPIIAFKNSGSKFLVEDRFNGLICDLADTAELSKNILYLAMNRNLTKSYGKASTVKVKEFYTDNLYHKWHEILNI